MLKKSFVSKVDRVQSRKFAYVYAPHQQLEVVKHKYSKTALVSKDGNSFIATPEGVSSYYNSEDAVDAFLKLCALTEIIQPVRKNTVAYLQKGASPKTASFKKTSNTLMDGDPWIQDAEMLIHKSSQDLWAVTSDSKFVARMFDPNKLVRD